MGKKKEIEIKPIHKVFAALVKHKRWEIEQVPEADREGVQHVLDTEMAD